MAERPKSVILGREFMNNLPTLSDTVIYPGVGFGVTGLALISSILAPVY